MGFQFKSELVTKVGISRAGRFISNFQWGAQEKFNGERRTIVKQGNQILSFNRDGNPSKALDPRVIEVFRSHPLSQYIIDIELVGKKGQEHIFILDVLILGDEAPLASMTYEYREKRAHQEFGDFNQMVTVVYTTRTSEAKKALMLKLETDKAEGIVFRKMSAPYKQGRSGQHFAIKFWKDLDAVVIGPSPEEHNSVRVGLFLKNGTLHEICGVSLNGKPVAKRGDVICMKYLYGTKELHAVQPELLFVRTDKRPEACTIDQLEQYRDYK